MCAFSDVSQRTVVNKFPDHVYVLKLLKKLRLLLSQPCKSGAIPEHKEQRVVIVVGVCRFDGIPQVVWLQPGNNSGVSGTCLLLAQPLVAGNGSNGNTHLLCP